MNLKALLFTITALSLTLASQATVHRVNNTSGIDADFNNISTAISSASAGDTLYVEGSATSYGTMSLNKELTVIGPGYFLTENDTTQAYQQSAQFGAINFQSGSSGSVISGLHVQNGRITIQTNDIVVQRCHIYYTSTSYNLQVYSNVSNVLITQNFIHNYYSSSSSSARCISLDGNNSNILVSNNIILRAYNISNTSWNYAIYMPSNSSAVFQNNTIAGGFLAYNSVVSGNVMFNGTFSGSGNTITGNVGNSTQFGSSNGNRQNVDVAGGIAGTGNYDRDAYWYAGPDTMVITAGNPVNLTGSVYTPSSSSGTYNSTFNLPPNIVTAVADHRWAGSYNYNYWRIDGVQTAYWSGNSSCNQTGTYNTNINVLSQVQGKSSVTLQTQYSWYNGCYPHESFWDFTFTLSTDYTILPLGAGAYVGSKPYRLSGMPPIPAIFQANVPSSGVTSEPFIFDFGAKSHK